MLGPPIRSEVVVEPLARIGKSNDLRNPLVTEEEKGSASDPGVDALCPGAQKPRIGAGICAESASLRELAP
jgi:hypothetical protein